MKKTELDIQGMHCASCATIIQKSLSKTNGVKYANVNYASSKATIEYNPAIATQKDLLEAVANKGYSAKVSQGMKDPSAEARKDAETMRKKLILSSAFAIPAFIIGMVFMWLGIHIPYSDFILWALATPVQFVVGMEFYRGAFIATKNRTANMDTLIALGTSAAYMYSAYLVVFSHGSGQYFETSAILITLVILGKYLEANAKGKTTEAISSLIKMSPKTARIKKGNKELIIPAEQVLPGYIVIVKPGEKIPVDGKIIRGDSSVDESMITGESIPADKTKGSQVYAGTINKHGSFTMLTERVGSETTLSQIIRLVEDAQGKKAPIQRFADSVSAYFVPIVIVIAVATFSTWILLGESISFALLTSISVLVIACPCALGLATPTAIIVGTGKGAKRGMLIKGGDSLETAEKIRHVVFDKTGTLTKGTPEVTDIITYGSTQKDILAIAASIERNSEHSLADAVISKAEQEGLPELKLKMTTTGFKALPGFGIEAKVGKTYYVLGNEKLILRIASLTDSQRKIIRNLELQGKTTVILAKKNSILGIIAIADTLRPDARATIQQLNAAGVKTYMITGDNERTAKAIADQVGIKNVFAGVLPAEKADYVKNLQANGGRVAMIGDGINDAPAIAQADIGIAMGSGTDVALETGNIVLTRNSLEDIPKVLKLSRMTMSKIRQNMFWALFYNVLGIPLAAGVLYSSTGLLLSPIIAGGAMALSSTSVLANSLLLKHKRL